MATRMLNLNNLTSSIGASLPNPLRSKKKYHFDVTLTLQELENCTFVSGVLYAKLQLKDGGTFNGSSHRYIHETRTRDVSSFAGVLVYFART